jgi:hypothetical protein
MVVPKGSAGRRAPSSARACSAGSFSNTSARRVQRVIDPDLELKLELAVGLLGHQERVRTVVRPTIAPFSTQYSAGPFRCTPPE